jgi:hypothetical protein
MGRIRCPKTSVKDYHSKLRNSPEEHISQISTPFLYWYFTGVIVDNFVNVSYIEAEFDTLLYQDKLFSDLIKIYLLFHFIFNVKFVTSRFTIEFPAERKFGRDGIYFWVLNKTL